MLKQHITSGYGAGIYKKTMKLQENRVIQLSYFLFLDDMSSPPIPLISIYVNDSFGPVSSLTQMITFSPFLLTPLLLLVEIFIGASSDRF